MIEQRRVQRLALGVPHLEQVPRARRLLEEGLRLTHFGGEGLPGRLLIRRLELGSFSMRATPGAIARRIAAASASWLAEAVVFNRPEAAGANVVWVPDEVQLWFELIARACRGAAPELSAWFWPRLVPGLGPAPARSLAQRRGLRALLALPEAGFLSSKLVEGLAREGLAARFLEQLEPADDGELLHSTGHRFPSGPRPGAPSLVDPGASSLSPQLAALVQHFVPLWGARHPRSLWLCYALERARSPARAADPRLALRAVALAQRAALTPDAHHRAARAGANVHAMALDAGSPERCSLPPAEASAPPADSAPLESAARGDTAERRGEARPRAGRRPAMEESPAPDAPSNPAAGPQLGAVSHAPERPGAAPVEPSSSLHSRFGGLFFLLRVLERLQVRAFLLEHPALAEAQLPRRWLERVADGLGIEQDDPIRLPLSGELAAPVKDCAFRAPPAWTRELIETGTLRQQGLSCGGGQVIITEAGVPLALWAEGAPSAALQELPARRAVVSAEPYRAATALDVVLDAWDRAVSLWLARYADVVLVDVVHRSAAIWLTATHLDLVFDIEAADVRLRRAALDVNLGYVPWFDRIITFHYVRQPLLA